MRIVVCGLSIACLIVNCRQENESQPSATSDTMVTSDPATTTIPFTFNPENEFLGLGVPEFGDLDSMVARRRIRALVPYTHLYITSMAKNEKELRLKP